jgi:hypothetical protein
MGSGSDEPGEHFELDKNRINRNVRLRTDFVKQIVYLTSKYNTDQLASLFKAK